MAELCPFDAVAKRRWTRRGENVPRNGVVVSSGLMIAPFLSDSIARFGMFYQPSFSSDTDFLKSLVLQELRDNLWSKMFSSAENQAACFDAITLCRKFRAKIRHRISEDLSS